MAKLSLTMAFNDYDRVRGLGDGTVPVEGCDVNLLTLSPSEEIFFRAHHGAQFEVSEMSMSRYLISTSRGKRNYIAIPVFISRTFRHGAIYIRTDRGIARPEDLRGKLVGVPEYQMTAALWVRGLLADEYGVPARDLRWRNGGLEMPGRVELLDISLPENVELQPIPAGRTLSGMLADGELDAVVASKRPSSVADHPHIARLFPDYRARERDYFSRTGIFPIMHVVVIRKDVLERHRWLPDSLYKAFVAAKDRSVSRLAEFGVMHDTLPWLAAEVEETRAVMGEDYWPYGVEANRTTLEAMMRYVADHGLATRAPTLEELFPLRPDIQFKK